MQIISQSSRILSPEDGLEALKAVEYAGRTCYRSAQAIAPDSAPAFVARLIAREHLSPLEFAGMTVELTTSRDVMAELTRHRLSSFCVESQRFVDAGGDIQFIRPENIRPGTEAFEIWREHMLACERAYARLRVLDMPPQDARKVLPNSAATHMTVRANLRQWRHIFALRTAPGVYPEMRALMGALLKQAKAHIPVVFDDLVSPD